MKKKLKEYDVTVLYKAVTSTVVKAENENEARKIVMQKLAEKGIFNRSTSIQDYEFTDCGVVNLTDSWGEINN